MDEITFNYLRDAYKKLCSICKNSFKGDYIKIISVFSFFFLCFAFIYLTNEKLTSLDDQVFSIRYAELLKENGVSVFSNFPWLHFSTIAAGQRLFSYNFIFYLVLTLFTYIKPLFFGIKLYGVIFASISFTALYFFFLKYKIRHAFFWVFSLFAIVNPAYTLKLLMARSFTIAPALLLLEIYFLHRKKYWSVFFISIFYFFWHSATFFFPLGVAVLYFAFESLYKKKNNWKIIGSCLLGLALSFIFIILAFSLDGFINFFSELMGIFRGIIFGKTVQISQGVELSPVNALDFVRMYGIIFALFIISSTFEIYNYIESKRNNSELQGEISLEVIVIKSTLFFLSSLFFLGSFLSGRNIDFFVYFAMAYIAVSFDFFIKSIKWQSDLVKRSFLLGIAIVVIYFSIGNILDIKTAIENSAPIDVIQQSAGWLKNNTEKGEIVFTPTMNFFTTLFYYDTNNYYVIGAEPKILYDYNPQLYWAWSHISMNGYLCLIEDCPVLESEKALVIKKTDMLKEWNKKQGDAVADFMKSSFKTRFIVTSADFKNLNYLLENSERFEKVFTDNIYNKYFIYKIKD